MIFRAQLKGRCQLHLIDTEKKKTGEEQDVQIWTEEWLRKAQLRPQNQPVVQTATYQTKSYQITEPVSSLKKLGNCNTEPVMNTVVMHLNSRQVICAFRGHIPLMTGLKA
jgi:hypothetical protein